MYLTTGKALLIHRNAELLGDAIDVNDVEMDEGIRSRVTRVLREVDVNVSSCNGNEPRKVGLELMLPLLPESEPLVPGNSARRVLNVENRNDLLVHAAEITARVGKGRVAWASVAGMSPDGEAASRPDGALGSVSAVPVARSATGAVDRRAGRETSASIDAKR
jgi:hypothetical protein